MSSSKTFWPRAVIKFSSAMRSAEFLKGSISWFVLRGLLDAPEGFLIVALFFWSHETWCG
jgi:hypothetical protein